MHARVDPAEDEDEVSGWVSQLCLWSLNPATAFRSISEQVRSVILTSGTLSPLESFASEARPGLTPSSWYPACTHAVSPCPSMHSRLSP